MESGRTVTPRGIPSSTVTAMPSIRAPGTPLIVSTAVRKMPSRASMGPGAARFPISSRLPSAVMSPALMSPDSVRKSPTPAERANLKGRGSASCIRSRRGLRLSRRNAAPERKTRARACCQEQPYCWQMV